MSSKIHTAKTTKKKHLDRKKQIHENESSRRNTRMLIRQDDDDSDDSSLSDKFLVECPSEETDDTGDSSGTSISQEISDEETLIKYVSKVRGNELLESAANSGSGSESPLQLREMMIGFRKQFALSPPNENSVRRKFSAEDMSEEPSGETRTTKSKFGSSNQVLKRKYLKRKPETPCKTSTGRNKNELIVGKKQISKVDKRVPLREEAAFQKSSFSFSDYSRSTEWKNKPDDSTEANSLRQRRSTKNPILGLAETRKKSGLEKMCKADTKDRRNKIIDYLSQIDHAEKMLQSRYKSEDAESSDPVNAITSRDALLKKYGFELTSKDELLKLGGVADKKRKREKRKILFPRSSSSSSGSDISLDAKEVASTLNSFLGERGADVDVSELVRHGVKWRNCLEDGECQCRRRTDEEEEQMKEDHVKKLQQFLSIFDGKDPPHHEYTREDLLKAHEKIGPWIHDKSKRLDKFLESGKYSPQYLLNIWDGRLSSDSSGDEPNFDKYREEYKKKLAKAQEDGTPLAPEDRVPTLEENNWFLFSTPLTRMYGNGGTPSPTTQPNSRAAMEAIASDLKRKREIARAKEYLEQGTFPEPHLYPRPIDLKEKEAEGSQHPLLGLFPPATANK